MRKPPSFSEEPPPAPVEERRESRWRRARRRISSRFSESISYPKAVIFITGNEFFERFTFYGVYTILSMYLKNQLHFSDNSSTAIFHVFVMLCYFFPLAGGIMSDSWLGKYKTILYLSIVYCIANGLITVSAIPGAPAVVLGLTGLISFAVGAGCVKPCMAAFGGDQFILPQQESYLKKFFSIFYFTINAGSFIASVATPVLRQIDCMGQKNCYSLGFGIPAIAILLSMGIFFAGTKHYKIKKPEGNIVLKVLKCVSHAIKKRDKSGGHWLDKAADKYDPAFINDIKATFRILVLYIPLPFFWALFDQQGSRWTFQASRMNGDIGAMKVVPDQMQVINPILILVFIPLFEAFVYPGFARYHLLKSPLQRLTTGGFLAAAAFVVSAIVEYKVEETYAVLPKPKEAQINLYNAMSQSISVDFVDPDYDPITIPVMDFWKKYDIPAKGETKVKFKYTAEGEEKTETLSVFENTLTSYIIMPDKVLQIRDDAVDKTEDGHVKVMVVYSQPTKRTTVTLTKCGVNFDFIVTKAEPFTEYEEFQDCEKYNVLLNGKPFIEKVALQQGGVYVIFILETESGPKGRMLNVIQPNTVHMLWLVPQYVIITAAEVMFSITGLEFSFTQAPISMKVLIQAAWLLTIAFGNLIVAIVAESKVFERQLYEFLLFAGLMAVDMCIFSLMAMRYNYVKIAVDEEDQEDFEKRKNDRSKRI